MTYKIDHPLSRRDNPGAIITRLEQQLHDTRMGFRLCIGLEKNIPYFEITLADLQYYIDRAKELEKWNNEIKKRGDAPCPKR